MDKERLAGFLREANRSGYANKDVPRVESSRLNSEDYHFEKDDLVYHDTYFGARDFIGEEIVYENGRPIWGANYFGFLIDEKIDEKEVYAFLRQVLLAENVKNIPVRGPEFFSDGVWEYRFTVSGELENFQGEEMILFEGAIVYRCLVHGGWIN